MIYLYAYLVVGILVFIVVLGAHLISIRNEIKGELSSLIQDVYRFLVKVSLPILFCGALVFGWPVVIWMKLKDMCESTNVDDDDDVFAEPKKFEVQIGDLQEKLDLEWIESKEKITDPLQAVPSIPFGHLNSVWLEFLSKSPEGCEYWSFESIEKTHSGGGGVVRVGYASVYSGEVKAFFISAIRNPQPDQ